MKYHYFCSFTWHRDDDFGSGNYEAVTNKPIHSIDDVRAIEAKISEDYGYNKIVLLHFLFMRVTENE